MAGGLPSSADSVTLLRINLGYGIVKIAIWVLLLMLVAFLAASYGAPSSVKDFSTALASVAGVVGTVVGAFFGFHTGAAGKEKADERADVAQRKSQAMAEVASPEIIDQARAKYPELFK